MKQLTTLIATLMFSGSLFAATPPAQPDKVLLTVNKVPVTDMLARLYAAERKIQPGKTEEEIKQQRIALINEVINTVLLSEQAVADQLDQEIAVKEAINLARRKILAQVAITKFVQSLEITDDQIEQAYKRGVERLTTKTEYQTRHILADSEEAANKAIERLNKGEAFDKLAREVSTDLTNKQGGELGWLAPQNMQPEFAAAVEKLAKNDYTKTPVKTSFGWHVIQLEDQRTPTAPALKDIREGIINNLKKQKLGEYVNQLRQTAKIEITGNSEK